MKKFSLLSLPPTIPVTISLKFAVAIPVLLCLLSAQAQKAKYPTTPRPLSTSGPQTDPQPVPSPVTVRRHIDLVKLQQDADELSKIAQTNSRRLNQRPPRHAAKRHAAKAETDRKIIKAPAQRTDPVAVKEPISLGFSKCWPQYDREMGVLGRNQHATI